MIIHDKLSSSLNCELSTDTIWKKLETLYDMAALVSFPLVMAYKLDVNITVL